MTPPSDRVPLFNEAAREAAARIAHEQWCDNCRDCFGITEDDRAQADAALNAALEALPPRSKAILALVELSDEELVERIGEGFAERENARRYEGGPHTSPMVEPTEYEASDFEYEARAVLTVLGLPVAEQPCPDPNCNEGMAGPDDQRCATCDGEGFVRASDGAQDECVACYDERRADARPPAEQETTG